MVSRDTRRAFARIGNQPYRSTRVAIRRSVRPDDADPLDEAGPVDDIASVDDIEPDDTGPDDTGPVDAVDLKDKVRIRPVRPARPVRTTTRSDRPITANRARPVPRRLMVWVAAIICVLALVTAALQGWQYNNQRQLEEARQQALAAARQTTVNFVTISAATVDRDLKRVADGATGDFKDEFTRAMPQVRAAVVENKVDSRGTVLRAAVVSADRGSAVVLVAVDANVRNVNAPTGHLAHYRIRVNLALVDGVWLVSTLEFVG